MITPSEKLGNPGVLIPGSESSIRRNRGSQKTAVVHTLVPAPLPLLFVDGSDGIFPSGLRDCRAKAAREHLVFSALGLGSELRALLTAWGGVRDHEPVTSAR